MRRLLGFAPSRLHLQACQAKLAMTNRCSISFFLKRGQQLLQRIDERNIRFFYFLCDFRRKRCCPCNVKKSILGRFSPIFQKIRQFKSGLEKVPASLKCQELLPQVHHNVFPGGTHHSHRECGPTPNAYDKCNQYAAKDPGHRTN